MLKGGFSRFDGMRCDSKFKKDVTYILQMDGQIDKCFLHLHNPWMIASAYFSLRIVHHHTISHGFFLQIVSRLVFLDVGVLDPESEKKFHQNNLTQIRPDKQGNLLVKEVPSTMSSESNRFNAGGKATTRNSLAKKPANMVK